MDRNKARTKSRNTHPALGILAGVGLFIIVSLIWGYVAGGIVLFLGLYAQESWWRLLIAFTIWYIPMLVAVGLSYLVGSRFSGKGAGILVLAISLVLFAVRLIVEVLAVLDVIHIGQS